MSTLKKSLPDKHFRRQHEIFEKRSNEIRDLENKINRRLKAVKESFKAYETRFHKLGKECYRIDRDLCSLKLDKGVSELVIN